MVHYQYNPGKNHILTYPEGILVIPDVINYFQALMTDDRIRAGAIEIVHFVGLKDISFTYSGCIQLSETYRKLKKIKGIAETQFIVDSNLTFGMARMLQTVFERIDHPIEIKKVSRQENISP